ncbi:MAG: TolC family protein [Chlamydiota bacterium]
MFIIKFLNPTSCKWFLLIGVFVSIFGTCDVQRLYDLTLEQAELITLDRNNQVNSLRELYAKAKEGRLETLSKWLPQVQAMSSLYGLNKLSPVTNSKSAFLTQLSVTQALVASDRYYNVKIADLGVQQLELLLNAAIIDALFQVRTAYYQVILDMEMISAAKEKIELLTSLSKRMEDRYQIGTSILYNVNQSKVAIANATTHYYEMIKRKKIDMDAMASILGFIPGDVEIAFAKVEIPLDEIPEIKDKLNQMQALFNAQTVALNEKIFEKDYPCIEERAMKKLFTKAEIILWEEKALKYQPNLKVSETDVQIAGKEVLKRKGEYLPTLSLNVNYGGDPSTVENLPSSRFNNQTMQWGVGLQFNWLLFDGLGRERRIKQARFEKRSKEFKYRQAVQDTYADVRKQIFDIEESVANYVTADANVRLAEQTVTLANDQLGIGYATIYDYQISVDGFIQAVNNKNKARFDLLKAYYGLRHATGIDLTKPSEGS